MIAVIGSGPAGVSAALYLKRANKDLVVFTNHKSSLMKAKKIDNYYGTGPITGNDLYLKGLKELNDLNIKILEEEVFNIFLQENIILETNKETYQVDAIVLATGSIKNKPKIIDIEKYEGNGVSYCATCDGYFFKNKRIGVVGNGEFAIHELNYLKNITKDLVLLTNGENFQTNEFETYTSPIKQLTGYQDEYGITRLTGVIFQDDKNIHTINLDALFIASDSPDSNILAKKCGIITDKTGIVVNENFETNVPGIYACGDAIKGPKQIAKATYEGMMAATSIIQYINHKKEL